MSKAVNTQKALNLWALILIIWSLYRVYFRLPEWFDEFVAKPLVFVLPVLYFIANKEKKSLSEGLWLNRISLKKNVIIAVAIGSVFYFTGIVSSAMRTGHLQFIVPAVAEPGKLFLAILTVLATGTSEEILSRGFILKRLYDESKNMYTSSLFASFLFFFLHLPILFTSARITGSMIFFFMATDLILSMVNSLIYLERKSLVVPILIHAFYNLTFYLLF